MYLKDIGFLIRIDTVIKMKRIWIATSNKHKIEEFQKMMPNVEIKSMKDLTEPVEIIEDGTTFEENAMIKAKTVWEAVREPVISDDSGLEVDGMNKMPGVYSSRWMGEDTGYDIKNQAIIDAVKDTVKTARYVCVIAYVDENGKEYSYRGTIEGEIYPEQLGSNGFGYDPIFYYPPFHTTLANVSDEMKNSVSHRGEALRMFLKDQEGNL